VEQVVQVHLDTGSSLDPGAEIRHAIRDHIFDSLKKPDPDPDPWARVSLRDSINARATSFLIGHVIKSGNAELVPYPYPSELKAVSVANGTVSLAFNYPLYRFLNVRPADWPATTTPGALANIDHIVVLLQENRSFDHMLGYLSLPPEKGGMGRHDVDGLKGGEFNMLNGSEWPSFPLPAGDTIFSPGPPNGPEMVAMQINGGKMDGFVRAQAHESGPATAPRVMGYHTAANVPTYDALARDFAVGHRWFASHPGPTFPNRFYELTGRPNIDPWGAWEYENSSPAVASISETIFEHLTNGKVSWRCFEHGYSFIRRFERYTFDSEHVVSYDDPAVGFRALALSGNLPSVSFIEPHYVDYPPDSFCDEPPSDIRKSQKFIRDLVEAVVAGPKWEKTLLLITYDEHGGFFDHVPPPFAVPVAPGMLQTTGARVPSFVISPWVKGGSAFGSDDLHFEHTSILKSIARRFLSADYPYLGARYAAAHDLSEILDTEIHTGQFRPFIPYTLVCGATKLCLAVAGGSTVAGGAVRQAAPDGAPDQDFAFEDAGDGFVYIRSNLSGLYVTVDAAREPVLQNETMATGPAAAPTPVPTPPGTGPGRAQAHLPVGERVGPPGSVGGTAVAPTSPGLIQEAKYGPLGSVGPIRVGTPNPALQRWRLTPASLAVIDRDLFVISSEAFPGQVLQPVDPAQAGSALELGDPGGAMVGVVGAKHIWRVSTRLIGDAAVATTH